MDTGASDGQQGVGRGPTAGRCRLGTLARVSEGREPRARDDCETRTPMSPGR